MNNNNLTISLNYLYIPPVLEPPPDRVQSTAECHKIEERVESNLTTVQPIVEYFKTLLFELVELSTCVGQYNNAS